MRKTGGMPRPDTTLRLATTEDAAACVDLWVAACADRDGERIDGVAERAAAKFVRAIAWIVAERPADGILGFALATAPGSGHPDDPADAAVLGLLAVHPVAQGEGLGARMLGSITDELARLGHPRAALHVLADNTAAVRLYSAHGWRDHGRHVHSLLHRESLTLVRELG